MMRLGQVMVFEKEWVRFDAGGVLFALHAVPAAIASQIMITDPPRRQSGDLALCDGMDPEGNVFQIAKR